VEGWRRHPSNIAPNNAGSGRNGVAPSTSTSAAEPGRLVPSPTRPPRHLASDATSSQRTQPNQGPHRGSRCNQSRITPAQRACRTQRHSATATDQDAHLRGDRVRVSEITEPNQRQPCRGGQTSEPLALTGREEPPDSARHSFHCSPMLLCQGPPDRRRDCGDPPGRVKDAARRERLPSAVLDSAGAVPEVGGLSGPGGGVFMPRRRWCSVRSSSASGRRAGR
jgi:hypothetical protein